MRYIVLISLFVNFIYAQCDYSSESQCSSNNSCEWVEDIEIESCNDINSQQECSQLGCSWYSGSYYACSICCWGNYEVDNSYCQEIEVLECSEMNQLQCNSDDSCDWIDSTESISCNSISSDECSDFIDYGCYLDADCIQWGSWYTWLCYQYGPSYCTGGDITIGDSYCEDSSFVLGDANGDGTLNVSDVILIVQTILSGDYDYFSDYNQDGIINVTDVIGVINAILGE